MKLVNFVKIVQGNRPLGAIILVKFHFFSVLGAVNPHPWTDQGETAVSKNNTGRDACGRSCL